MPGAHSHKVRLVGIDGQEQPIIFDIESEGVHLLSQKAQLKTAKGLRELRVKADSEKQAKKILKQLEATVQALVDKRRALAAKQQIAAQKVDAQDLKVQPGQQAKPNALQHAAPSDMFSFQPSMLVSGSETIQQQSAAPAQAKSTKSPLGKTDPSRHLDSRHKSATLSRQQQSLSAISQTAVAPVTLSTAKSTLAASSRQLQPKAPSDLVAFDRQASLQPSSSASHQASASLTLPSTRQSGSASLAQASALSTKQSSSASAKADQLTGSGSAISPRQRRDPSPAELALAKQKSLAAGMAAPDAHAFVLSPSQKKDSSSAGPRLITHQSGASKGNHMSMQDPNPEGSVHWLVWHHCPPA